MAARDVERIVRLQRDEHRAIAALVDEVEAVIEELAEQREPRVEWSRQAFVRRGVGDMNVGALEPMPLAASAVSPRDAARGIEGAALSSGAAAHRGVPCCSAALPGLAAAAAAAVPASRALAFCMTTRA